MSHLAERVTGRTSNGNLLSIAGPPNRLIAAELRYLISHKSHKSHETSYVTQLLCGLGDGSIRLSRNKPNAL
jgi:hypothetical protein